MLCVHGDSTISDGEVRAREAVQPRTDIELESVRRVSRDRVRAVWDTMGTELRRPREDDGIGRHGPTLRWRRHERRLAWSRIERTRREPTAAASSRQPMGTLSRMVPLWGARGRAPGGLGDDLPDMGTGQVLSRLQSWERVFLWFTLRLETNTLPATARRQDTSPRRLPLSPRRLRRRARRPLLLPTASPSVLRVPRPIKSFFVANAPKRTIDWRLYFPSTLT